MTDDKARPADSEQLPDETGDDTEGHSMQMVELGRTVARDRAREAEQIARESRMRDDAKGEKKGRRSFFRR